MKDSSKIYQLKGLKPKNIGHTKFYECCDLTKKIPISNLHSYFSGSGDMKIMQWDLDTKKKIKSLDGHNGDIAALNLKPQDNQV